MKDPWVWKSENRYTKVQYLPFNGPSFDLLCCVLCHQRGNDIREGKKNVVYSATLLPKHSEPLTAFFFAWYVVCRCTRSLSQKQCTCVDVAKNLRDKNKQTRAPHTLTRMCWLLNGWLFAEIESLRSLGHIADAFSGSDKDMQMTAPLHK